MNRRQYLVTLGTLAAGSAGAIGTGAFSSVEAERSVTVNVAGDSSAYLGLQPTTGPNSDYVHKNNGQVEIALSGSDNGGSGFNKKAVTEIDEMLKVTNQGTQTIYFWIEHPDSDPFNVDNFWFYTDDSPSTKLHNGDAGDGNDYDVLTLRPGDSAKLGVKADFDGVDTSSFNGEVTFYASSTKPDDSGPVESGGEETLVVTENPTEENEYETIQGAIDEASDATILVEPGRYNESLEIGSEDTNLTLAGAKRGTPGPGRSADDLSGETETILESSDAAGLSISGGANVTINGFVFDQNNYFVDSDNWGEITITNSILANSGTAANGHIDLSGNGGNVGKLEFKHNYVTGNDVSNGIRIRNGTDSAAEVDITDNLWKNNAAWAMNLNQTHGDIRNNTFQNTDDYEGETVEYDSGSYTWKQSGILLAAENNELTIQNNQFSDVDAAIDIYGNFTGSTTIQNNTFSGSGSDDADAIELSSRQAPDSGLPEEDITIEMIDNSFSEYGSAVNNELPDEITLDASDNGLSKSNVSEGVTL